MREQLASFNEFNDPGPELKVWLMAACPGGVLKMPVDWRGANVGQTGRRKRKAVPPKPQADARVELTIKLVACEYLEENLLMTGSHWGSEMGLGNLISIV